MAKSFPDQMSKVFDICLWIPFAILTFVIIEKMVPGWLTNFNLPKKCKMCSDVMGSSCWTHHTGKKQYKLILT